METFKVKVINKEFAFLPEVLPAELKTDKERQDAEQLLAHVRPEQEDQIRERADEEVRSAEAKLPSFVIEMKGPNIRKYFSYRTITAFLLRYWV